MTRWIHRFLRNERAAVAPTVALALFGLIAIGGVAFDYARLASMDTELQQAADQAALAAATQLDRSAGARARATAAIQNPTDTRLASNLTRFAKADATSGMSVEITGITFCKAFDDTKPDATACTAAATDSDAGFVMVTTQLRTARYAFTPIVGLFSGAVTASAVAGVQSSICNIAPLFVCTDDVDFPDANDVGIGLLMKTGAQNSWFPGNYGFLNFGNGNQGVIDALLGHGLNGCQPINESNTAPGNKNATDGINTRFDIYDGTGATKDPGICNLATGDGCPAADTGKDLALQMTYTKSTARSVTVAPADDLACGATGGTTSYASDFVKTPAAKGFERDDCHYSNNCTNGNFGDGVWNYSGYMAANHPGVDTATIPKAGATPTRYEVYTWELANVGSGALDPRQVGATTISSGNGPQQTTIWTYTKQCNFLQPKLASAAYPAEKDRRILPVVAAKCTGLNGASSLDEFQDMRVFDVFLTEPSLERKTSDGFRGATDDKEIYGEVLGPAETFGGSGGFQYYSRNKPYLVR
jgi:Flp pilus assembly protein TadG